MLSETDKPFCPECGEFFVKAEAPPPTNTSGGDYSVLAWVPMMVWVLLQVIPVLRYRSLGHLRIMGDPIDFVTFLGPLALVIFIGVKFGRAKSS